MTVLFGIDVLVNERLDLIRGRRLGLISNASGVNRDLRSGVDALLCEPGVTLITLFGPEHGYGAAAPDGAPVASGVHPHTGLPVFSLYGDVRKPTADMLEGLDVLMFNIQCVGVRFYTYVTTLLYSMQAAAEHGLAYIVCDRPNPIGGEIVEGPVLEPGFESFVGPGPLPIRHGLTVGELARLFNEEWGVGCDLTVVPCVGWKRDMWFEDTGLPWAPPSPAMPWPQTATVYPGLCLLEGTNLSEGRGTALPFHLAGAPWIDGHLLAEELNQLELPGVHFRGVTFQPTSGKWAGKRCGGVQLHVTDREGFRPLTAALHLLRMVQDLYPEEFAYPASGSDASRPCIDLLAGTDQVRLGLRDGASVPDLVASWGEEQDRFVQVARKHALYV
jgi:uncharacterized protein YbbC (DUF1343 family)